MNELINECDRLLKLSEKEQDEAILASGILSRQNPSIFEQVSLFLMPSTPPVFIFGEDYIPPYTEREGPRYCQRYLLQQVAQINISRRRMAA